MSKSPDDNIRPPRGETPGDGRISMASRRASAFASTGEGKVSAICVNSAMGSAPSAGVVELGVGSSATSRVSLEPDFTTNRASGVQGSAGRNCRARGPSQRHSPAGSGVMLANFSCASAGPPFLGPASESKNTVTGSQSRRNFSGTTRAPSAR